MAKKSTPLGENQENLVEPELESQEDASSDPQDPSLEPKANLVQKLKTLLAPLYVKILLSTAALILLTWAGLSTCSTPASKLKQQYIIGLDPSWYPLHLQGREINMTAFCETLLKEITRDIQVKIDIIRVNSDLLFSEFYKGSFDGVVSMMLPSAESTNLQYIASDPLYRLGPVLVVNAKHPYQSLEQMDGKIVALVGVARVDIAIDHYPDVIFSGYATAPQAFADLENQQVDAVIVDSLAGKSYVQGLYAGKLLIADTPLTSEGILLILHKTKDTELFIELFNQELKNLRENGSYRKLLQAWRVDAE